MSTPVASPRQAARAAKDAEDVPVPSESEQNFEQKSERVHSDRKDPWSGGDPWGQFGGNQTGKQPSYEDFVKFCEWQSQQGMKESEKPSKTSHTGQGWKSQWYSRDRSRQGGWHGSWYGNGNGGDRHSKAARMGRDKDEREPRQPASELPRRDPADGGPPDDDDDPASEDGVSSARTSEVRSLLMKKYKQGSHERPKSSLGSVRVEDFYGERNKYRTWKRVVLAQQKLYQLENQELSMLVYLSCKKEARDVLDQLTLEEMMQKDGLERIWRLLDEAYDESAEEHFERIEGEFMGYRRLPGQSVASYLSQLKRLKAEYQREDPETKFSSRSWAQRMLVRASLSRRERLDVFFSAGGSYDPKAIERALRHRCQKIHEDERKVPVSSSSGGLRKPARFPMRSSSSAPTSAPTATSSSASTYRFKKKFVPRSHGAHVADIEEEGGDGEDEDDLLEEDLEQDPEAYEAFVQQQGEEPDGDAEVSGEEELDQLTAEELKEAYAAGWRAKDQINARKKERNFARGGAPGGGAKRSGPDPRKASTTCSSCGQKGHWRGDPQCPHVVSGQDKPFQPKPKEGAPRQKTHFVNFVRDCKEECCQEASVSKPEARVHEINFTFMATKTSAGKVQAPEQPPRKSRPKSQETAAVALSCPQCDAVVRDADRFCSSCGVSLAVERMTDKLQKRGNILLEYASSEGEGENDAAASVRTWRTSEGSQEVATGDEPPTTIPIPLYAAQKAAGVRKSFDGYSQIEVKPVEAVAALEFMSKEEKRAVRDHLRREGFTSSRSTPAVKSTPMPPSSRVAQGSSASSSTMPRPPESPADGRPKAVLRKERDAFRWELYAARVDRKGKLTPSDGASRATELQLACFHPWEKLVWSANQHGHFARCRDCDLKNVLVWHERHGAYMVREESLLPMSLLAIGDSGCKTAVGGSQWHDRFQAELRRLGLQWHTVQEREVFKFGAGDPIVSTRAHIYPVGLHGSNSWVRMSEVGHDAADCPGLIGPADMARWNVIFRFQEKMMDALGSSRPMRLTATRHPGLNLLEYGDVAEFGTSAELQQLLHRLRDDPCAFAFWQDDDAASESSVELIPDDQFLRDDDSSMDEDVRELVEDMESLQAPLVDVNDEQSDEVVSSDACSTTSHEFGVSREEDSSSASEVEPLDRRLGHASFMTRLGDTATMTKGKKRRLRSNLKTLGEVFHGVSHSLPSVPRSVGSPTPTRPCRPYKVLEIFTWTMAITMCAVGRGWTGCEPVTLPRWDLRSAPDRAEALRYVVREQPDLLVLAWPCTVWSPLQYYGKEMTAERLARLRARQECDRHDFLSFVYDAVSFQRRQGRAHIGENPLNSRAWHEPFIEAAYAGESHVRLDMCAFHLRRPDTGEFLRKPTRLAGTAEIVSRCQKRCPGDHVHAPTLGQFWSKHEGRTQSVADFAGGYTRSFAQHVVRGGEDFLDNWQEGCCTVFEVGDVPEERFIDADQEPPVIAVDDSDDETQPVREVLDQVPDKAPSAVRRTVATIHRRLGHPSSEALVRMLRLADAPKETLEYAQTYQCPTCASIQPPDRPPQSRPNARPVGFNVEVHVDLKYGQDYKGQTYVALSAICAGTNKHVAVLLKTRKPGYVARKFIKHWIGHYGRPNRIVMDQGGEFEHEWILMMESYGIHSKTTGSHAGWQHAFAERHGGILGSTWHAVAVETKAETRQQMAVALAASVEAKNELVSRRGYSANMLVFGKNVTFPELLGEDEFDSVTVAQSLDLDSEMSRRANARHLARQILLRDDVQQKLKRALTRKPRAHEYVFMPGDVIYFFVPYPTKPRYRKDFGRWRGPAVVVLQESHQKYFVSWRGRCLLLAGPNMRLASSEEAMKKEDVRQELGSLDMRLDEAEDKKDYEDLTKSQVPPEFQHDPESQMVPREGGPGEPASQEARRMMRGLRSMRKLVEQSAMLKGKRALGLSDRVVPKARARKRRVKAIMDGVVQPMQQPDVGPPEDGALEEHGDDEFWQEVREREIAYDQEVRQREERRRQLLDDLPRAALKRGLEEEESNPLAKRVKSSFYAMVMLAVSQQDLPARCSAMLSEPSGQRGNEWLPRRELRRLRRMLDLPITSARWHIAPRKTLQKVPGPGKGRVTVLLGEEPGVALLVEESAQEASQRPKRRAPFRWRGLTMFVAEGSLDEPCQGAYVQRGEQVLRLNWPVEKQFLWDDFVRREQLMRKACEVFVLKMKANGKELDSRHFDCREQEAFREADRKEWESWIKNEVIEIVPPERSRQIPRKKMFRIPLRWVRVNKNKDIDKAAEILAKSRLVLPGHADPGLGDFRTDAPTTTPMAVRILKSLAVTRGWTIFVFDVSTAFLSGKPTDREVYVRAPEGGLPKTASSPAIPAFSLLRILKSAYGLAEAPRLWYLRACELLEESGLKELSFARATFVKEGDRETAALCTLHVDDGMLAGDESSEVFQGVLKAVNSRFNIKEWKKVGAQSIDFLGCKVSMSEGVLVDCMRNYVMRIKPIEVTGSGALDSVHKTAYRRLVMQLRWPAQYVCPEKLFVVSALAQCVETADVQQAQHANKVLAEFQDLAQKGLMQVRFRPLESEDLLVVSFFDASLGKSSCHRAQQGQVHFLTTSSVKDQPTSANILAFRSSKITRVVKSSLAAEGNALSTAADEQLYLRLLSEAMSKKVPEMGFQWKENLGVPGIVVTDAKALYDHLLKTGHMTAERQTMLDILAAKQLVEGASMSVAWVPTLRQFADGLTKDMADVLFQQFKHRGKLCLQQTVEDKRIEEHRASLRRGQRERRKAKMIKIHARPTSSLPDVA